MIEISKHPQGGYLLSASQLIKRSRKDVFAFFSDAYQLEKITPPFLKFNVLTPQPIHLKAGALIDYKLTLRFIPIKWRTEISVWEPESRFVDQQLKGPFKKWHHEHTFESADGGTMVYDKVHYQVPGGWLVHNLIVKRDVKNIFSYRHQQLDRLLNQSQESFELGSLAAG